MNLAMESLRQNLDADVACGVEWRGPLAGIHVMCSVAGCQRRAKANDMCEAHNAEVGREL